MFFSRPIQWYHSHADLIWPDGTFKINGIKYTANEGPMRIQYKCLVPIYVFPALNCATLFFQNRIIMFCLPIPTLIYL
jgi:hypothetical protein